ncbi:conjugal transfer protein TraJ, partial [Escherichia coli]
MAADNSARAIFIRGLLLLGMMLYLIYSLGFQNTDELKQQITQEVNASRSLISNDRWLSVIANSEATLSTLI